MLGTVPVTQRSELVEDKLPKMAHSLLSYLPVSIRTGIVRPPRVMLAIYSALWVFDRGMATSETGIVLLFAG